MKRKSVVPVLAALLAALLVLPSAVSAQARPTVTVSSAADLLKAIGPNRIIQLKKGDYLLSSAYTVKSKYVDWYDSDEGSELSLKDLSGLTIRGVAGSRIVVDTPTAYLLNIEDSSNVSLENLVLARKVEEDASIEAGGLYAGGTQGLKLLNVAFEGPNGNVLELSEVEGLEASGCTFVGGSYGAIYATYSTDLSFASSTFSGNDGNPLVYLEECARVGFENCGFKDNFGGTLVELYSESGEVEDVSFTSSSFSDNAFDYFSGPGPLPETVDCSFDGNTFDEDWRELAVAPEQDSAYYGDMESEYSTWYFGDTGLTAVYPAWWDSQEGDEGQAVFQSEDAEIVVFFTSLSTKVGNNPSKAQLAKIFQDASKDLVFRLGDQAEIEAKLDPVGEAATDDAGLVSAWVTGSATGGGETKLLRARLAISKGKVHALIAFGGDEAQLAPESEAGAFLDSLAAE